MNPRPEKSLFEEAALLMGMAASFIEKDWYVTQVIGMLAGLDHKNFEVIFSGGTALSKAHKLLQRFSEDLDFRVLAPISGQSRASLSAFKHAVIDALRQGGFALSDDQVKAGDGNRFIAIELDYESYFTQPKALRPHIQIELAVSPISLPCAYRNVSSLVNELAKHPPEVARIGCLNPVESAADKLSALAWRIPDRDRNQVDDDPAVVRHLHDLAILQKPALAHAGFAALVAEAMRKDDRRAKHNTGFTGLPITEKFEQMLICLTSDPQYVQEYDRFVKGVSYAKQSETPDFVQALQAIRRLVEAVTA